MLRHGIRLLISEHGLEHGEDALSSRRVAREGEDDLRCMGPRRKLVAVDPLLVQHAVGEGVVVLSLRVVNRGALDCHLVGRKLTLQCADQVGLRLDDRERVDEARSPHIAPEPWLCSDGTCSTFEPTFKSSCVRRQ